MSWLEQAARLVTVAAAPEAIVIADYGSSEGRNSLVPMALAIRILRDRVGPERGISVVHTDLPGNDFSSLFETLDTDTESYLYVDSATFASAVGRSFYRQILPSDSVTLGWSSWAVQWLSRTPEPIPDHLQVAYSRDPVARAAYSRQAAEDWRTFLAHRGRELRPAGRLVVLTMALSDDGDFGYRPVLGAMYEALLGLVEEGYVSLEEARRMAIPTVGRSHAELIAPFTETGCFADLSIERADVFFGEDVIWKEFERDHDADVFGARWAAFSRASVFHTLARGLSGGRDDPRAAAFIEKLEVGMAARLAAAPEPTKIPLARIALVKC
jgi:hypothetical protein